MIRRAFLSALSVLPFCGWMRATEQLVVTAGVDVQKHGVAMRRRMLRKFQNHYIDPAEIVAIVPVMSSSPETASRHVYLCGGGSFILGYTDAMELLAYLSWTTNVHPVVPADQSELRFH